MPSTYWSPSYNVILHARSVPTSVFKPLVQLRSATLQKRNHPLKTKSGLRPCHVSRLRPQAPTASPRRSLGSICTRSTAHHASSRVLLSSQSTAGNKPNNTPYPTPCHAMLASKEQAPSPVKEIALAPHICRSFVLICWNTRLVFAATSHTLSPNYCATVAPRPFQASDASLETTLAPAPTTGCGRGRSTDSTATYLHLRVKLSHAHSTRQVENAYCYQLPPAAGTPPSRCVVSAHATTSLHIAPFNYHISTVPRDCTLKTRQLTIPPSSPFSALP